MVVKKTKPQKSSSKKKTTMKNQWNFDRNKFIQEMNELNWLYKWVDKFINSQKKEKKLNTKYF